MSTTTINKPSGYSIYNEDVKKRTKHNTLPKDMLYPKLSNKKFDIIYADPLGIITKNCNMTYQKACTSVQPVSNIPP